MVNRLLCIVLFLVGLQDMQAQQRIDSLENALLSVHSEEDKIKTEILLAEAYLDTDIRASEAYLKKIYKQLNGDSKSEFWLRYHLARSIYFRISREIDSGKIAARNAFKYAEIYSDSLKYKAKIYNALGALYDDESNIEMALENHLIALRYAERSGDSSQIANVSAGIGRAYQYLGDYDKAKVYYEKAVSIKENSNQFDLNLGRYYSNLSNCFDADGEYEKSLEYLDKSIALFKKFNNAVKLSLPYNNKAYTLYLMKRYKEAEENVIISLAYSDSIASEADKSFAYSTYGEILFAQNRVEEAETQMLKSIELTKKTNDLYLKKYNLDLMYNIYLKKGNYKKALDYYKQRSVVLDSVNSVKTRKEVEKLALEYETEKKNTEIATLNAESELNANNLKKSRQLQIAFLIAAILSLAVLALLRSRHRNKIKTNKILKESMEKSYEKKLSQTELQALRAQMDPHFLFNCLNSINSFIIKNDQERASEYLSKFSMLIRKVLNNSKSPKVTLANELEALDLYIEMEAMRFSNSFSHGIIVADNVEKDYLEIPPLIIQPFVENSIWHGLMNKTDGTGKLTVAIQQEDDTLICVIEDNGIGREAAKKIKAKNDIKHKSFGMNITEERLQHINEKQQQASQIEIIDLKSDAGEAIGTRVIIKIAVE